MKIPCVRCGKVNPSWCNRADCQLFPKSSIPAKQSFSGATPNLFVGRANYPDVNVGVLATEDYSKHDDPLTWTREKTPIPEIMAYRSALINSTFKADVQSFPERYDELRQLVAQSEKAVAIDVNLTKKPVFTLQYPSGTSPHGPSVALKDAALTENVHVPNDVEKTLSDELRATEQVATLAERHDNYYLQKLMSAGLLGIDKKLVPTRWSITAVDDTLGKQHLAQIREFPVISEPLAYVGGHYGNYYCILFLPHRLQYELFELYVGSREMKDNIWTDYEGFLGRTSYADSTVGGYYAARLGIMETMLGMKRQASVLAFRFVTDEYTNPLGVWVVREAVKLTMQAKPLRFASDELAIMFLEAYAKKKFNYNVKAHLQVSKLLTHLRQKTLSQYEKA